jgi:hypothetical protein
LEVEEPVVQEVLLLPTEEITEVLLSFQQSHQQAAVEVEVVMVDPVRMYIKEKMEVLEVVQLKVKQGVQEILHQ